MPTTNIAFNEIGATEVPRDEINTTLQQIDNYLCGATSIALPNSNTSVTEAQIRYRFITFTGTLTARRTVTFPGTGSGTSGNGFWVIRNTTAYVVTLTIASGTNVCEIPADSAYYIVYCNANSMFNLGGGDRTEADYAWDGNDIDMAKTQFYKTTATDTPTISNISLGAKVFIHVDTGGSITFPGSVKILAGASPAVAGDYVELWCINDTEAAPEFVAWVR
jgi:hypothetical protein